MCAVRCVCGVAKKVAFIFFLFDNVPNMTWDSTISPELARSRRTPPAPGPLGRPVGLERPCFLGLGTAHWDCEYTHGASSVFAAVHVQREPSEEELERH